jgi:hypothetical protein
VQDDAWLDQRTYDGELPAAAERALRAVGLAWDDEATAEGHLYNALALAPGHLAVQIAAYKFYFYRHRLTEVLPYAQVCLAQTQRRNQLPADWRDVRPEDAAFTTLDPEPRMFLFTLVAYGYVLARLGQRGRPHCPDRSGGPRSGGLHGCPPPACGDRGRRTGRRRLTCL